MKAFLLWLSATITLAAFAVAGFGDAWTAIHGTGIAM